MSQISVALSEQNFANFIAEQQSSASAVDVRKGLPVVGGTAQNQVKPIPTGTSTILSTIMGIAQDDANAGDSVRLALAGQVGLARIKGTGNRNDYLICKTGSTTDAENGSLQVQATIVNGDLVIGRLLEDATDQSYVKISVMMYTVTAS